MFEETYEEESWESTELSETQMDAIAEVALELATDVDDLGFVDDFQGGDYASLA